MNASDLIKYAAAKNKEQSFIMPAAKSTVGGLLGAAAGGLTGAAGGGGAGALIGKALGKGRAGYGAAAGAGLGALLGVPTGSIIGHVKGARKGVQDLKDKRYKGYKPSVAPIAGTILGGTAGAGAALGVQSGILHGLRRLSPAARSKMLSGKKRLALEALGLASSALPIGAGIMGSAAMMKHFANKKAGKE